MARPKKNRFADLDEDFKSTIDNMSEEEIRNKISEVALNQEELMKAKEEDQDLKEAQIRAKEAGATYREGTKHNRLRIQYARLVLESRGKL